MKKLLFCISVFMCLAAAAQKDTTSYKTFTAAQLQQDLDSMYFQMQANHPDLFAHYPKQKADAAFTALRKQVNQPMNRLEFTRMVSPFVALFRDGHTFLSVEFDSEDFNLYAKSGRFFPLSVVMLDDKLYCTNNSFAKTLLQKGDEIISINGVSSKDIIHKLKKFWSADNEENAAATAQRLFGYSLWAAYNWGNETDVVFKNENEILKERLEGISKADLMKLAFYSGVTRQLHLYPEQSLAVVEINSYGNVTRTNNFIDSCFAVIKKNGIKNVALDLRKNGGGNSYIGDYFLAHVTKRSFNTVSAKRWRIGPLVNALKEDHWMYKPIANARKDYKQEGEFLQSATFEAQAPTAIKDTSLYVDVNFFLLTSAVRILRRT